MNFLQDKKAEIYALGRIVFGFLFMLHGIGKLTAGGAPDYMWAWAFWVAGLLETIGGALIVVGLFGQSPPSYAVASWQWHSFQCTSTWAVESKDGIL